MPICSTFASYLRCWLTKTDQLSSSRKVAGETTTQWKIYMNSQACIRIYYGICWLLTASFTPYFWKKHPHVCETSPIKTPFFPSYTCLIYHERSEELSGFVLLCKLTHVLGSYIKFLFVRPDVCRRLPSESNSRWTPLSWAGHFPLSGRVEDLHLLE